MNKLQLVNAINHRLNNKVSKATIELVVDNFVDIVKDQLQMGNIVKLVRFGAFTSKFHMARPGINPRNGQPIEIPARRRVKFKQYSWELRG